MNSAMSAAVAGRTVVNISRGYGSHCPIAGHRLRTGPFLQSALMVQAAFFDLDKTIIAKSSTLAFTGKLHKAGLLGRRTLMRTAISQIFYVLFGADHDQLEKTREMLMTLTKGWDRAEIERIVEETLDDVVAPLVYAEALFLIDEHLRDGRRVYIVSASPEEVVRPLAHYIGVEDIIATRPEVDDRGRYTGEVEMYAYAEEKAVQMEVLAAAEDIDLSESYAYSDSATDLPMLKTVGHPHAVNPDKELREAAEEHGWPILEFSRQVGLSSKLTRPVPLISGATIAAGLGTLAVWLLTRRNRD
jgi:HAD superfamily hydrolase (TIGR01490 family)